VRMGWDGDVRMCKICGGLHGGQEDAATRSVKAGVPCLWEILTEVENMCAHRRN